VVATIPGLGASPRFDFGIAGSDTAIWVHNGDTGNLLRVDPQTNKLVATIPVGHGDGGVALGQGAVWVASPVEGTVSRVDPQTNRVVATIPLAKQDGWQAIAVSPGVVWATDAAENLLVGIDSQTNQVVAKVSDTLAPIGVSYGAGSVWVCELRGFLRRLDPKTGQTQAQLPLPAGAPPCNSVVALDKAVWALCHVDGAGDSTLQRVDPAAEKIVATIPVPTEDADHFFATEREVGVYDPKVGVFGLDPATNRVARFLAIRDAKNYSRTGDSEWAVQGDGTLLRIAPAV
jgi:DNA-binding beta-propeller fold protein YncE